jgi:hypothetical protein
MVGSGKFKLKTGVRSVNHILKIARVVGLALSIGLLSNTIFAETYSWNATGVSACQLGSAYRAGQDGFATAMANRLLRLENISGIYY